MTWLLFFYATTKYLASKASGIIDFLKIHLGITTQKVKVATTSLLSHHPLL